MLRGVPHPLPHIICLTIARELLHPRRPKCLATTIEALRPRRHPENIMRNELHHQCRHLESRMIFEGPRPPRQRRPMTQEHRRPPPHSTSSPTGLVPNATHPLRPHRLPTVALFSSEGIRTLPMTTDHNTRAIIHHAPSHPYHNLLQVPDSPLRLCARPWKTSLNSLMR